MKYLLLGALALGLVACDDGGSDGPAEPCTMTGCADGEVCKNLGFNETTMAAQYECVVPRAMGAECEEDFQCEETCSRIGRTMDAPLICTQGCDEIRPCPDEFSCDPDLRRCVPQ